MGRNTLRRRDVLKGVLAATGFPAIVPASAFGANSRIVMANIGVGGMGSGHCQALLQIPDVQVVAVCDVRRQHRDRAKQWVDARYGDKSCATYNDFREVLARKDIDAVAIAVPDHWHALIGIEAARNGKDMYYEKPMGLTFADARAMREAVRRYGVVFQFGTQQRSSREYRYACELVRNGHIGELQTIVIGSAQYEPVATQPAQPAPEGFDYDLWLGPAPWAPYTELRCTRNWTLIYDYSLGCISGAWGIHDVDIAQWANDADHSGPVSAEGTAFIPRDGLYDTPLKFEIEHHYANGVKLMHLDLQTAKVRYQQFHFGGMAMLFIGTKGWIYVSREGMRAQPESLLHEVIGPNENKVVFSNDHRENFLEAVRSRRQPISHIEAAVRSETVCQQADIAIRLGRKVNWDPEREMFLDDAQANRMLARPMRAPWRL
jgi:predicted dehydrogenase